MPVSPWIPSARPVRLCSGALADTPAGPPHPWAPAGPGFGGKRRGSGALHKLRPVVARRIMGRRQGIAGLRIEMPFSRILFLTIFSFVVTLSLMHMRGHHGRQGSSRNGARGADAVPAFLSLSAGRGARAGPKWAGALPFETEFRTGRTEGGFCGICFSKGLGESRIEIGVRWSSPNRSSGRESALTLPKKSEPNDGRVAQVPASHRPTARSAGVLTRSGSNNHFGLEKHAGILGSRRCPPADVPAAGEDTRAPGTWAARGDVGCHGEWGFVTASHMKSLATFAAPFGQGPRGKKGQAERPCELSSQGSPEAVCGPDFQGKRGESDQIRPNPTAAECRRGCRAALPSARTEVESPAAPQAGAPALWPLVPGLPKPTAGFALSLTINHQLTNYQPSSGPLGLNPTKSDLIRPIRPIRLVRSMES